MTDLLIDMASYQTGIDLAKVQAAGFSKVNVKLSQGNWYEWQRAGEYINRARDLGMGVCTFHWLDNSASGAEQARIVLGLMRRYGAFEGAAHQCDCEDPQRPASWAIWRDYMSAMQDGLQRHVVNYTGDWWWPGHMGNRGAEVTPYLWAGPNAGYLSSYAGDTSGHWRAGYGGWGDYSMLQYAVQPIPGAGGGDLSKTAIRDPAVWAALTGGTMAAGDADRAFAERYTGNESWIKAGSWMAQAVEGPLRDANRKLDSLASRPAVEVTMTAEDRAAIVDALAAQLPTAAQVADELAKRLGNG